jgi:glycosyltransferase involved in cell wall biosynthesis
MNPPRICIVPKPFGVGGMVSFRARLVAGLAERAIEFCFDLHDTPYDAILIIGGSRQLAELWRARQRGIRIVQRLDGMNWLHRRRKTGLRHFFRAEIGNWLLAFIRAQLANSIIYQSDFSRHWWEQARGTTRVPYGIIYNGVDLHEYSPAPRQEQVNGCYRLLLVEGSLGGGYELGVEHAINLFDRLSKDHHLALEIMVVGRVAPRLKAYWNSLAGISIRWIGQVPQAQIPEIDRSAHLLFSADLNPSCPNAVIEAMACGLPVVAFDTGALPELVQADSGRVVPYGGNPWRLEPPNLDGLAQAAAEILANQDHFRQAARARAEAMFGLDKMVAGYLNILIS